MSSQFSEERLKKDTETVVSPPHDQQEEKGYRHNDIAIEKTGLTALQFRFFRITRIA